MHNTKDIMKTKADPVRANWKLTSVTTVTAGTSIMATMVMRYTDTAIYLPVMKDSNQIGDTLTGSC